MNYVGKLGCTGLGGPSQIQQQSYSSDVTDLGLTLPTNGTEDYKIKIKDLPGITVGDWKS
jgi:hypothetical protein